MKKLMYLFVFLLPVVAFAQSEEEVAGGIIARAAWQSAPSQQQLAEKAKVSVHVKVTKRDDFKSDFLFTEYEATTTKKCEGVITGTDSGMVHVVVQSNCLTKNDVSVGKAYRCRVNFFNEKNYPTYYKSLEGLIPDVIVPDNSPRYYPNQGDYILEVNDSYPDTYIFADVPLADLTPRARAEIQGISLRAAQAKAILVNAPAPKELYRTSNKVSSVEEEVVGGIARAAQQSAPSQPQPTDKAKVKVRVDVTKRDDFTSDFLFTAYEVTTIEECEGVITGTENEIVNIVVQNDCITDNDAARGNVSLRQVSFLSVENSLDYLPTQGHNSIGIDRNDDGHIMISVPLADLAPQVRAEIQGLSRTRAQADAILENAPTQKVFSRTYKKVS